MKTLTMIGCGHVGRTLAYLWHKAGVFHIGQVLNRSPESSLAATQFIGAGTPIVSFSQLEPADVFLIAASDNSIAQCCASLAQNGAVREGTVVLHCSGSLSLEILAPARSQGARLLSVHPLKSFADPSLAVETFAGTYCGVEGDVEGETAEDDFVIRAFKAIGANIFPIGSGQKAIYHAAIVFGSNYLVALLEVALRCYEQSGIAREQAIEIMQPIIRGTVNNVFQLGTVRALTGPIARGDDQVVQRQCEALEDWDPQVAQLYGLLGSYALELSVQQGNASPESIQRLHEILNVGPNGMVDSRVA